MTIHNNIEKVGAIKLDLYRFLKKIAFFRNLDADGCTHYDVEIILSNIRYNGVDDLKIRCIGATNIRPGNVLTLLLE
jgi:hypothetical protein